GATRRALRFAGARQPGARQWGDPRRAVHARRRYDGQVGDKVVTIRVVLVDDHAVVRRGLEQLLSGVSDITVVGTAADGEQAIEVVRRTSPDVVLMDLQMPGIDGVAATRQIVADGGPDVLVLRSCAD